MGVFGQSNSTTGGAGVFGKSDTGEGVRGESSSAQHGAVVGVNTNPGGVGVFGKGGQLAGQFEGNVSVLGTLDVSGNVSMHGTLDVSGNVSMYGTLGVSGRVTVNDTVDAKDFTIKGGDCAEEFEVTEMTRAEPGTVMVINREGSIRPCLEAYDYRVAGVISGAGGFATGITLDKQPDAANRRPLALVGKVFCKVDADYEPIDIGDLLTTSSTCGHAMKATDRARAFGSVLGKALGPLASGRGMVPILVTLQ